ncbi:hypothetical protein PSCLAVI8L_130521 [Pseudoclavibacter sp. 8L]|nr:hypothetical protein PSCLAVI8L_130521 [Pseudoclavibacter sp. 8L]
MLPRLHPLLHLRDVDTRAPAQLLTVSLTQTPLPHLSHDRIQIRLRLITQITPQRAIHVASQLRQRPLRLPRLAIITAVIHVPQPVRRPLHGHRPSLAIVSARDSPLM